MSCPLMKLKQGVFIIYLASEPLNGRLPARFHQNIWEQRMHSTAKVPCFIEVIHKSENCCSVTLLMTQTMG